MKRIWLALLSTVACAATPAAADIFVSVAAGTGGTLTWTATPLGGNRYSLDIEVANMPRGSSRELEVTSDASDIIESCTIVAWGDGTGTGGLPSISVDFQGDAVAGRGAIESIESISITPALPSQDQPGISIDINLDDTAGTGRLGNAGGTTRVESLTFGTIECRELTADIQPPSGLSPGDIGTITVNGDMTGNVEGNDIGNIIVSGDIGVTGSPGVEVVITANGNIERIEADNINADIDATGDILDVYVFGSGSTTVEATDAVFQGSLDCQDVTRDGIRIWGDLEADITIRGELAGTVATRIAIGDDLATGATISIGTGMTRGITIGNMESAVGEWNGDIIVDGVTLSPTPEYRQAIPLNGAVGVAPYGVNRFQSSPAYTNSGPGTLSVTGTETKTITLDHYGIIASRVTGRPFTVKHGPGDFCDPCPTPTLVDVSTQWSWEFFDELGTDPISDFRKIELTGPVIEGRHYRIRFDETLRCRDIFGEPDVAVPTYLFVFNTD